MEHVELINLTCKSWIESCHSDVSTHSHSVGTFLFIVLYTAFL